MQATATFPRTSPQAEGIDPAGILAFIKGLEQHEHPLDAVQGFMLLRHGHVAAEGWWAPYTPDRPHNMFSLSKSFCSTGISLAVAEGLLTVNDTVLSFFPDDAPAEPSANLQAMTVRHLLSMNTGHHEDTTGAIFRGEDENWAHAFLAIPPEHEPGSWFVYNTGATYMLSAIITRVTGQSLRDYLTPRLFDPLGIDQPEWDACPRGISLGGTGLHARTEDVARLGQLYLQRGEWNGTRILSEAWIDEASAATSDNSNTQTNPDWSVGYGYQFWRCRHNAYRGDGAFGQYMVVLPEQDAVLAITSGLRDMQRILDLAWEHLLPAMEAGNTASDTSALQDKLASLSLPLPGGNHTSPKSAEWSGTTWQFDTNEMHLNRIAATFDADHATITLIGEEGEQPTDIGYGAWLAGSTTQRNPHGEPVAAAGAWSADDTFTVHACYTETETCLRFIFQFNEDTVQLTMDPNAGWDAAESQTLTGHRVE